MKQSNSINMIRDFMIAFLLILPMTSFSQVNSKGGNEVVKTNSKETSFDEYCKQNALRFMDVPVEKRNNIVIAGEVTPPSNPSMNYLDYGIQLKEGETQYFTVVGSDQLLVAQSLYVLRLNYSNSKK